LASLGDIGYLSKTEVDAIRAKAQAGALTSRHRKGFYWRASNGPTQRSLSAEHQFLTCLCVTGVLGNSTTLAVVANVP